MLEATQKHNGLDNPVNGQELDSAIMDALNGQNPLGQQNVGRAPLTKAFVGKSRSMAVIVGTVKQIAWSDAPVLIQGETGSGKEVLARELHANSQRARKAFFKLNCAALPSELVESELFGYERGAFTGAFQRKPGIFEAADQGTILLDEIGDMDVRLQAKLLQVLQDHSFQRIGGKDMIKVDVRVIAATHCDLEKSMEAGGFREDLYYRLNVINLMVPPLRERKEELFDLADFLLKKHANQGEKIPAITPELGVAMMQWHWPGNIRELENFARRLLIFRDCSYLERDLQKRIREREAVPGVPVAAAIVSDRSDTGMSNGPVRVPVLAEVSKAGEQAEARAILAALNAARWNRRTAAAMLNVDYKGLLYKMKKLGVEHSAGESSKAAAAC